MNSWVKLTRGLLEEIRTDFINEVENIAGQDREKSQFVSGEVQMGADA